MSGMISEVSWPSCAVFAADIVIMFGGLDADQTAMIHEPDRKKVRLPGREMRVDAESSDCSF
jgi:hypothetical protein